MSGAAHPAKVLVVEDEEPVRRVLVTSLAAHGYEGQFVVVVPDRELTVVHLGKTVREVQPPLVTAIAELIEAVPIASAPVGAEMSS